jgi:hypothetical protein
MGMPTGLGLFGGLVEFFGGAALILGITHPNHRRTVRNLHALYDMVTEGKDETPLCRGSRARRYSDPAITCARSTWQRCAINRPPTRNLKMRYSVDRGRPHVLARNSLLSFSLSFSVNAPDRRDKSRCEESRPIRPAGRILTRENGVRSVRECLRRNRFCFCSWRKFALPFGFPKLGA